MSYYEDLNVIKEEIARKLGITISDLENELEKIRKEAPGLISEKLSLLLLMERHGIVDPDTVKRLSSEALFFPITELSPGMQGITVIGRIERFLRERNSNQLAFLLRDKTGRAIVIIRGRNLDLFKRMRFEVGDIIMIKNANVSKSSVFLKKILVDDDSEIDYMDELDLVQYGIAPIPRSTQLYSVSEILKISTDLIESSQEINVRGIASWLGELTEISVGNKRRANRFVFRLRDERNLRDSIRVVVWGNLAEEIKKDMRINNIVLLEGCVLKENNYLTEKTGKRVLELHLGSLSNYRILGTKRIVIRDLKPGIRVQLYAFIISKPIIKTFLDKENKERRVLSCLISDETGTIRLVVWNEEYIRNLESSNYGEKIMVIGTIRESKLREGRLEIHVSSAKDKVIIKPDTWPKELDLESIKKERKQRGLEDGILINDFSHIPLGKTINIEGYFNSIKKSSKEKGPICIVSVLDEHGNEAVLMIWNQDIVEKLESLSKGALIKLINVKSPKERKADVPVLFVGERSKIVINSLKHKSVIEDKGKELDAKPLSSARIGNGVIFGTVTDVLFIGKKRVCPECGLLIVTHSEEGDVCARGHIVRGILKPTLIIVVDDDIKTAKVILTGDLVKGIVNELEFTLDEVANDVDLLDLFKLKFIGRELVIEGVISEESLDTDYLVIANRIMEADLNKLKRVIRREIER